MHSIYQFGFKVNTDATKWQEQISGLFDIEFKIETIVNEYPNIEKNWLETIRPCLNQLEDFELIKEQIEKVHASFNRYQSYVYLTLVFKGDITKKYDFIEKLQEKFRNHVTGFIDNFEIPFKEPESEKDKAKYTEILGLENPVLVTDDFTDTTYVKTIVKPCGLFYKFDYNSQNIAKYSRKFKQVYIAKDINNVLCK